MSAGDAVVCVVDDDASVRKALVRFLLSAGFAAEAFDSARAYLDRPACAGPSCLILDVPMPELSGPDLQRTLIGSQRAEQVILLNRQGDIPMCARAMKAGAVDFLPKPFEDGEMLAAVERALARSREQRLEETAQADARTRAATLTRREAQVLARVVAGKLNKEIAAELGTSIKTVKVQRHQVMAKMGAVSIVDLVRLAGKAGAEPSRKD